MPVLGHFPSWTVHDFTSSFLLCSWNRSLPFPSIISINKQIGSRVLPPNISCLKNKAFPSSTSYGPLPHFCIPFPKKNFQNGKFNFLTLVLDSATLWSFNTLPTLQPPLKMALAQVAIDSMLPDISMRASPTLFPWWPSSWLLLYLRMLWSFLLLSYWPLHLGLLHWYLFSWIQMVKDQRAPSLTSIQVNSWL